MIQEDTRLVTGISITDGRGGDGLHYMMLAVHSTDDIPSDLLRKPKAVLWIGRAPDLAQAVGLDPDQKLAYTFSPACITYLESVLELTFLPVQEAEGQVCYASSSEVRDDFKISFTEKEVLDYLQARVWETHEPPVTANKKHTITVAYPTAAPDFWKTIKRYKEARKY